MTSPAHDATALAAALALFPVTGDPTGLMVAAALIGMQGVMHAHATREQERAEAREDRKAARLQALGFPVRAVEVRWRGPAKSVTRPLRLVAIMAAAVACLPAGVALACARLPDQLEVGPIDHRKLTHYLVTAAAVIYGAWCAAVAFWPDDAERITMGFATGYVMHLVADGFTRHGVPYFWPLLRRRIHLLPEGWRIKTGGRLDTAVMLGCVGAVLWTAAPG